MSNILRHDFFKLSGTAQPVLSSASLTALIPLKLQARISNTTNTTQKVSKSIILLSSNFYIPDGEPHIFGDSVYIYGSHDRANGTNYCEDHYEVWSAPVDNLSDWR